MRFSTLLLALSAATLGACPSEPAHPTADLVLTHGDLRTMEPALAGATALAVRDGRLVYVGSDQEASKWIGPASKVLDASGHTVLPGLIDSHIHAAEGALARGGCSLADEQLTIEQAAPRIRACVEKDTRAGWLTVTDVNPAGFKANRQQLDAIVSSRPLFLWGTDGHTAWVNSRALELAKITRKTANPDDGRIERDARGEATGFLVDGALGLVLDVMEKPTPAKRLESLRAVQQQLHAVGITSYLEANTDAATVAAYVELSRLGELRARVTIALESSGENTPAEFSRLKALRAQVADQPLLRADFVKLFADGVMEYPTQTAAMLAPYLAADGKPGKSSGKLYLTPANMAAFIQQANADDFNIHVHAIGDAAVRETLDVFAAARASGNTHSFSIAHLQLIDPSDIPRFAKIHVLASLQLLWARPDNYSIEAVKPYIGDERLARTYPARALVASGAVVAGGSDWDVSSFNPFEAMASGMSRINPKQPERGALNADQALTLDEMLAAYTINAARVLDRDEDLGSLVVGKAADFVILGRRLTAQTTADAVRALKPAQVFFAGVNVTP
jgi:predicted amidohydrolase YtcJ